MTSFNRRQWLQTAGAAGLAGLLPSIPDLFESPVAEPSGQIGGLVRLCYNENAYAPSDAVVGPTTISTATKDRVAIYQRIACDAPNTPSRTDMKMGAPVLLNPSVYSGSFPPITRPAGITAGLRS